MLELQLSLAVHLFPKDCIYIRKLYCTENIQNVHNYRYNIPQSWPGDTKQVYLALEKLLTPAYQCNIVFFKTDILQYICMIQNHLQNLYNIHHLQKLYKAQES